MKRLFLLEDDLSLISGLSFAVKKQGYDIDAARTILEADTLWANGSYDLAILDVSLLLSTHHSPARLLLLWEA